MSLITLRSQNTGVAGSSSESSAYIRNYFKEEIAFLPGDTFELVSISITKIDKFEVITGQNDKLVWRIGAGPGSIGGVPKFVQHIVTLPQGGYNGQQFASVLQSLMNQSVILGNYSSTGTGIATEGGFEVVFTPATSDTNAKFAISYYQQALPPTNGDTLTVTKNTEFLANQLVITQDTPNNAYNLSVTPANASHMGAINSTTLSNSVYGNKSVFPNGGEVEVIISPILGIQGPVITDLVGNNTWQNFDNGTTTGNFRVSITPDLTMPNGWEYKVLLFDGLSGIIGLATPTTPGTGYTLGDTGTFTNASLSGSGGSYEVSGATGGGVTSITIIGGGSGYTAGETVTLSGAGNGDCICTIDTVVEDSTEFFGYLTTDGQFGLALDSTADATLPANWNRGTLIYNTNSTKFVSINHAALPGTITNPRGTIENEDGTGYTINTIGVTYPRVMMGVCRNQLILGKTQYPGNADASINNSAGGFDIQFVVGVTAENDDIQVGCTGFVKAPGVDYPLPNWRTVKTYIDDVNQVYKSTNWNSLASAPANWTNFTFNLDHIKVRMERYGVDKTRIYMSHDNNGDGVFTEEVVILQQDDTNNGVAFTPAVREIMYPFVPAVFFAKGSRFGTTSVKLKGIYDLRRLDSTDSNIVGLSYTGNPHAPENVVKVAAEEVNYITTDYSETGAVGVVGPQTLQQLSSMFKFGLVEFGESNGNNSSTYDANKQGAPGILDANNVQTQLSGRSLAPNFANMNILLGFERWYTFDASSGTTQTLTTPAENIPQTNILEPSLMVEFPDFNIRSYSGESSDTGRAIAVIPREQWTTNEKTGTLIYVAPYPIQIDLGVGSRTTLNELTCRLRTADGLLADDLLHPTEITIRKIEGEEQKQERILSNVFSKMNQVRGNIQDSNISNFNNNMPRI